MFRAARGGRRRVVIGPGLIFALLAAAFILWGRRTERPRLTRSLAPPLPGSAALFNSAPPAPAPDLTFVLRQQSALRLSRQQVRRLQQLEQRFEQETAPVRTALDQASQAFARQTQDRAGRGIRLPDLLQQAAAASALSRQLAAARRYYWSRAAPLLTPAERAQAEALWARQRFGVRKRASAFSPAEHTIQRAARCGEPSFSSKVQAVKSVRSSVTEQLPNVSLFNIEAIDQLRQVRVTAPLCTRDRGKEKRHDGREETG